jgi:N-acetylneuraminate synthase
MKSKKRIYTIAEVGINHNGSLDNCYRLIDAASAAGVDCVKFQFFKAAELYLKSAGKLNWKNSKRKYSYDIYKATEAREMPDCWIEKLIVYCQRKKIDFLSSIFGTRGVDYLISKGMQTIKLPSYSVTNLPLMEHCARFKVPIILSTGGATLGEIEEAVKTVNKYHTKLSLLHCSIKYPTELSECNLAVIKTLKYAFVNCKIGYSDHTKEVSKAPVQAIYLGAEIIEKHITLDKKMKGPDHFFALEPKELKKMICAIKKAADDCKRGNIKINKKLYGLSGKVVFKHEQGLRDFCFATMFAGRDIKKGERIEDIDLRLLRPGENKRGLEPQYMNLFKKYTIRAAKNIAAEEEIGWEKILNG